MGGMLKRSRRATCEALACVAVLFYCIVARLAFHLAAVSVPARSLALPPNKAQIAP